MSYKFTLRITRIIVSMHQQTHDNRDSLVAPSMSKGNRITNLNVSST